MVDTSTHAATKNMLVDAVFCCSYTTKCQNVVDIVPRCDTLDLSNERRRMSKISSLIMDIQEELIQNSLSPEEISQMYNVPLSWIQEASDMLMYGTPDPYNDSMDGDAESALASVGWGTDEDYGAYAEDV